MCGLWESGECERNSCGQVQNGRGAHQTQRFKTGPWPQVPYTRNWSKKPWIRVTNSVVGSGSALIWLSRIRIRIGFADPDPGAWKLTSRYVFGPITFFNYRICSSCKRSPLVTLKSVKDPDSHGWYALVWLFGSRSGLKLMRIHNTGTGCRSASL